MKRSGRLASWTVVLLLLAVPSGGPADAQSSGTFTLTAAADVLTVEYYESRTPAVGAQQALVVASPSSAQAALDSLGTSMAFASAPYPGPIVVSLPGTVAGVTGGQIAPPAYPLYVSSSHPTTAEEAVDEGVYRLRATSTGRASTGLAATGIASDAGSASGTRIAASTRDEDGQLVAEATTQTGLVAVDPLRVADLRSRATLTLGAGGEPVATTEFALSGLTVAGQGLELRDGELVFAGTGVPLESAPLNEALDEAGLDVQVLDPVVETTDDGSAVARSGGLQVTFTVEAPDGGASTLVQTLGRSVVTLATTAFDPTEPDDHGDGLSTTPPPPSPSATGNDSAEQASSLTPDDAMSADVPARAPPPAAPSPLGDEGAPPPAVAEAVSPTRDGPVGTSRPIALGAAPGELDGAGWYLMLVAAAVSALLASRLLGVLGVHPRGWRRDGR